MALILSVILFFAGLFNVGYAGLMHIKIDNNVRNPLEVAATFQDPNQQLPYFKNVVSYLDSRNLDEGNTCLFFRSRPDCELGNFHAKLKQDIEILNEIKGKPISSLDVTNAEVRIHQSLFKPGTEGGEYILTPDYSFAMRWGLGNILVTKLIEWFLGLAALLSFAVWTTSQ